MATASHERSLTFPHDAPCLSGHFPGRPVVPAVAILAELISWAERETGQAIAGVRSARFRRPLLPGVTWRVDLEATGEDELTLSGKDQGSLAMKARLIVDRG
jgi:3-hydroxymyristoyl/3-hydroxydecanoyl-(acyl carrier protein) dehydratase